MLKELEKLLEDKNNVHHEEMARRDYSGNTGDYRIATHDGANYCYISDWYGIAMRTIPIEELNEEQLSDLLTIGQTNI